MIQFYAPDIEATGMLPEDESAHCCRVLRHKPGDEIAVVDGKGNRFRCTITDANPKRTAVEISDRECIREHWGCRICLAVAPTKNSDRMEWLLEKATEIGVDEIVLLKCEHSERKAIKTERLRKILVSAMKQSLKAKLPVLGEVVSIKDFLKECREGQRFFGYCDDNTPRKNFAKECHAATDTTIMIGPEGDFSPTEVKRALEAGFEAVTFGRSRMRTETAALFAVGTVHIINQTNEQA